MPEIDPAQNPEEPPPKFRLNAQVFQILGLLGVALALPITVLILGLNGIQKEKQSSVVKEVQVSENAAEVPGLRQSLESIADAYLPFGPVESPMRIFGFRYENAAQGEQKRSEILDLFKRSGIAFVETGESAAESWIVKVETINAKSFEDSLLEMGFAPQTSGEGNIPNDSSALARKTNIYKIKIEALAP
ncbi:MAG: hypothetical protein ACKOHM_11100 [Spartobacteria bacterium]